MSMGVLIPVTYLGIVIFIGALVHRILRLLRSPISLRWELSAIFESVDPSSSKGLALESADAPRTRSKVLVPLWLFIKDALIFRKLFNANQYVWLFSYPMHLGLYGLVGMVGIAFINVLLSFVQISSPILMSSAPTVGLLGCALGAFGALGLLMVRLIKKDLRRGSTFLGFFNLLLIIFMLTWRGSTMTLALKDYSAELNAFIKALLTLDTGLTMPFWSALQVLGGVFCFVYVHVVTLMHFVAIFMSYWIQCDTESLVSSDIMAKEMARMFELPVSWAAPHIKKDEKRATWKTVASP
jgi:nitrate reductase gamma subunit